MSVSVKLVDFDVNKTLKRLINNDKVGLFMAETCARYMNPYIPRFGDIVLGSNIYSTLCSHNA